MVNDKALAEAFYNAIIFQSEDSIALMNENKAELRKKNVFLVRGAYMATALDADMLYNALTGFYFETDKEISNIATRGVKDLVRFLNDSELCYAVTYSNDLCFNVSKYISYFTDKNVPEDIYLSFDDESEEEPNIDGIIFQKDMADALELLYIELSDGYVYVKDFSAIANLASTPRGFSKRLDEISANLAKEEEKEEYELGEKVKLRVILD